MRDVGVSHVEGLGGGGLATKSITYRKAGDELTSEQAFCPSQAVAQGFPKISPPRYCLTRRSRASADLGGKSRDDDMTPFPRPELTKPVKTSHKLGERHDLHPT